MPFKPETGLKAAPFFRTGKLGPQTLDLKTEGKPPPPAPPKGFRIEDRIGVQAPAEVIWEIVYDIARWGEWNPTYPDVKGHVRLGETLEVTLALPGQTPQVIRPKVLEWQPPSQLHWELRLLGGAIKTIRYVEIESLAEASSVVDNGEIFGGLMGPSFAKRQGRVIQRGFKAMNEALKDRAEAVWRERQGK
jgi:hypothetical protein